MPLYVIFHPLLGKYWKCAPQGMLLNCSYYLYILPLCWIIKSLHQTLFKLLCIGVEKKTLQDNKVSLSTRKSGHKSKFTLSNINYTASMEARMGQHRVCKLHLVISLNRTPTFEWRVVGFNCKS